MSGAGRVGGLLCLWLGFMAAALAEENAMEAVPGCPDCADCLVVLPTRPTEPVRYALWVYPKRIEYGDTVYFCVVKENVSDAPGTWESVPNVSFIEPEVVCSWTDANGQAHEYPLLPLYEKVVCNEKIQDRDGGAERERLAQLNAVTAKGRAKPRQRCVVSYFSRAIPALEDVGKLPACPSEIRISVRNSSDSRFALRFEDFTLPVSDASPQGDLMRKWSKELRLENRPIEMTHEMLARICREPDSRFRPDAPCKLILWPFEDAHRPENVLRPPGSAALPITFGEHGRGGSYGVPWSELGWVDLQELEKRIPESTFRDEIHFSRMLAQYFFPPYRFAERSKATGERVRDMEAAQKSFQELTDWLAARPFPQRLSMTSRLYSFRNGTWIDRQFLEERGRCASRLERLAKVQQDWAQKAPGFSRLALDFADRYESMLFSERQYIRSLTPETERFRDEAEAYLASKFFRLDAVVENNTLTITEELGPGSRRISHFYPFVCMAGDTVYKTSYIEKDFTAATSANPAQEPERSQLQSSARRTCLRLDQLPETLWDSLRKSFDFPPDSLTPSKDLTLRISDKVGLNDPILLYGRPESDLFLLDTPSKIAPSAVLPDGQQVPYLWLNFIQLSHVIRPAALQEWEELEAALAPGTFRDEAHWMSLILRYLSASEGSEQTRAWDEIRTWLAARPLPQRECLLDAVKQGLNTPSKVPKKYELAPQLQGRRTMLAAELETLRFVSPRRIQTIPPRLAPYRQEAERRLAETVPDGVSAEVVNNVYIEKKRLSPEFVRTTYIYPFLAEAGDFVYRVVLYENAYGSSSIRKIPYDPADLVKSDRYRWNYAWDAHETSSCSYGKWVYILSSFHPFPFQKSELELSDRNWLNGGFFTIPEDTLVTFGLAQTGQLHTAEGMPPYFYRRNASDRGIFEHWCYEWNDIDWDARSPVSPETASRPLNYGTFWKPLQHGIQLPHTGWLEYGWLNHLPPIPVSSYPSELWKWKNLEMSLHPGTLRDEVHYFVLLLQFLDAPSGSAEEYTCWKDIKSWLRSRPLPQALSMLEVLQATFTDPRADRYLEEGILPLTPQMYQKLATLDQLLESVKQEIYPWNRKCRE